MFGDIGFSELLVVGVAVVILTKPEDLPVVMRRLGVCYAYVQSFVQGIWLGWQEKMGLFSVSSPNSAADGKDDAAKGGGD